MNKDQRESLIRQIIEKKYPLLTGSLSVDFQRTEPRPASSRKLFRARRSSGGVKLELRAHPSEDNFQDILSRAARAANEIASGTSNATEIGYSEQEVVA